MFEQGRGRVGQFARGQAKILAASGCWAETMREVRPREVMGARAPATVDRCAGQACVLCRGARSWIFPKVRRRRISIELLTYEQRRRFFLHSHYVGLRAGDAVAVLDSSIQLRDGATPRSNVGRKQGAH